MIVNCWNCAGRGSLAPTAEQPDHKCDVCKATGKLTVDDSTIRAGATVARSTSAGFSDGNLTGLFDRIDAAMAAEVLQCTSEGISIHDGDAIRPRMQAARERVTTSHRLAVEAALAQQKALDRDRAIRDELERRAAFDREWGLDK